MNGITAIMPQQSERMTRSSIWSLVALATGAFGIGITEFAPMGFLPAIAQGVAVPIPIAGLLISAYAIGVMVGAPIMTLAFNRFERRQALIMLMVIFTLGNICSALAPDYSSLMAARLVTSLNHGAFFGLGAIVAAEAVPKGRAATAVASMFMGLTIANVAGVPLMTWISHQAGWRMSFAATAVFGLAAMLALRFALPKGAKGRAPDVRGELRVLGRPAVLLALMTTAMGSSAMFALYTYISPTLAELAGASDMFVALALVVIGLGFCVGNSLGGYLADWSLDGATAISLCALALTMVCLPLLLSDPAWTLIGLFIWGAVSFAVVPSVQMRVMTAAAEAPALASSVNIGALNLGNAIGAAAGSQIITSGLGYAAIPLAGGLLASAGLASLWLFRALSARSP